MPLRDVLLDDSDREELVDRVMTALYSAVLNVECFRQYELEKHFDSLEIARDRLSQILDKARNAQ